MFRLGKNSKIIANNIDIHESVEIGDNVQIHFLKSSDHRLSSKQDLRSITNAIDSIRNMM